MGKHIFAETLRQSMKDAHVTQVQLARGVGVNQSSVSGWLNGAMPAADKLVEVARFLNVDTQVLLEGPRSSVAEPMPLNVDWRARALKAEEDLRAMRLRLLEVAGEDLSKYPKFPKTSKKKKS